jgi:hypothetical protein
MEFTCQPKVKGRATLEFSTFDFGALEFGAWPPNYAYLLPTITFFEVF